jgi:ABC-type multidrug transport system fused ATPase/permease subunit
MFLVQFIPPLIVFLILAISLAADNKSDFMTTHVYTIISYIGLIYAPLAQLPTAIVATIQATFSCRRIDNLLKTEDAVAFDTRSLQPGVVLIRNLVTSFED